MAKVVKQRVETFPPSDRELALRAQIRTGWSTISGKEVDNLSAAEMKQIQQVLERAQAIEKMEEVRIGLQMLKHKDMVEKCHGDGVTTCRICNWDFSNKRSNTPESVYYCADCQLIVCSRCKTQADKSVLCSICYEERELWKRSGFWLKNNYSIPTSTIPMEDLEEIKIQMSVKNRRPSARIREGSPRDFVNPYQLEVEEDEDDDDDSMAGSQRLSFSPSLDGSYTDRTSPSLFSKLEEYKASKQSSNEFTEKPGGITRSRQGSGLSRRSAINKANRDRFLSSRDRARSRSHSGSRVPGPSATGSGTSEHEELSGTETQHVRTGSIPGITIRKPSTQSPPVGSPAYEPRVTPISTDLDDSEPEPSVIHQILKADSTDSDIIISGGIIDVEKSVSPIAFSRPPRSDVDSSPSSASQSPQLPRATAPRPTPPARKPPLMDKPAAPVPRPRRNVAEDKPAEHHALVTDEFRKVPSPLGDDFRKVGASPVMGSTPERVQSSAHDDFKKTGASPVMGRKKVQSPVQDEFRKIGSSQVASSHRTPERKAESPAHDEFRKIGGASPRSGLERIGGVPLPSMDDPDLFKKVGKPPAKPPAELKGGADTHKSADDSDLKKVSLDRLKTGVSLSKSLDDRNFSELKKAPVREEVKVETSVALTSAAPPQTSSPKYQPPVKPVAPTRRRVLPAVTTQQQDILSTDPRKNINDIGKQDSVLSTGSVMSEVSTTLETDHSVMDSPTSVTSSGSSDGQTTEVGTYQRPLDPDLTATLVSDSTPTSLVPDSASTPTETSVSDLASPPSSSERPARAFTRKNATRVSRNRRPSPQPQVGDEDSKPDSAEDPSPRFRARSGMVSRPARRPRGGQRGSGGEVSSGGDHVGPATAKLAEEEEEQLRGARGSSLSNQDRGLARRARIAAAQQREAAGQHTHTPKYKTDGEFGSIQLTLSYHENKSELSATIHSCKGLRGMDKSGLSDPYVKVFLQPRHKLEKFRTRTVFKNLNPHFEETFTFTGLTMESLEKRKLCAVVMDYDELSKDDLIGGTMINLYEVIHAGSHEICIKRLLDDRSVPKEIVVKDRGSLHLYIQYSSDSQALVISVVSAKNLPTHGQYEVYVKCHWTSRSQTVKARTKYSAKTTDPEFNEDLHLKATLRDLTYSKLLISIWEHRPFKDKLLGEIHFNNISFWKGFVSDPSTLVQDWYSLEAPAVSAGGSNASLPRYIN